MPDPLDPRANMSPPPESAALVPHATGPGSPDVAEEVYDVDPIVDDQVSDHRPMSIGLLLRFKWMMLGVFALIAVPGLFAIWNLVVPTYRAVATIEVEPLKEGIVFDSEGRGAIAYWPQYISKQKEKLKGNKVAQYVVDRPEVSEIDWYHKSPPEFLRSILPQRSPLERLQEELEVLAGKDSTTITIAFQTLDPTDAKIIANAVRDEYLRIVREESDDEQRELDQERENTQATLQSDIAELESKRDNYRKSNRVISPETTAQLQQANLFELENQQRMQRLEIENLEDALDGVRKSPAGSAVVAPEEDHASPAQIRYRADSVWRSIAAKIESTRERLEDLRERAGEDHRDVVALTRTLTRLEKKQRTRARELDDPKLMSSEFIVEATPEQLIEHQLSERRKKKKNLDQLIRETTHELDKLLDHTMVLGELERTIETKREYLQSVKRKRDVTELERYRPATIKRGDDAVVPSTPYEDKRIKLSLAVLFGGLFAGIGAAYLRAVTAPSVQEVGDVMRSVAAPFLGSLPLHRRSKASQIDDCPVYSEHVRMIRTALLQRLNGHTTGRVVQITSAGPGAGKTTFATMLGRSLARCGKRVLLVDADLRNPSIGKRLGIEAPAGGLISSLQDQRADEQTIQETDTPGMSVLLSAAPVGVEELETLANGRLADCLSRWRESYDIVLIDSSPILPVADARILARHADGTILVVRERHCRRPDILDALACLRLSGGELFGTVFVGESRRGGYKSYQYGYGANYGSGNRTGSSGQVKSLDAPDV